MLRPLNADGTFLEPFDTNLGNNFEPSPGYVEGTPWQYTFFVPHDMPGLIRLMGGKDKFVKKLQHFFDEDLFNMSNEPDIACPYLFNYVRGAEWRSQKEVRNCIDRWFHVTPGGLPGNDDTGTLSAWLVFSMMGLYPDCPGKPEYALVSPVFDQTEITLNRDFYKGEKFRIETRRKNSGSFLIDQIRLNAETAPYFISHRQLTEGGILKVYLSGKPEEK
jgi:predicted alpha-1,2-mannosidase